MEIKLTREEVLIIYEFLKKLNLKFAKKESAVAIVCDLMKIKDTAQHITQENEGVVDVLQDEDFRRKTQQYIEAKRNVDNFIKENNKVSKNSKLIHDFEEIAKEYKPLYENFADTYAKAILELDQEFIFDLKKIKLEDIIDVLNKSEIDYTVENISMIYKIIE